MRIFLAAALTAACAPAAASETLAGPYAAQILRVIDGDTVEARVHVWLGLDLTASGSPTRHRRPRTARRLPRRRPGVARPFDAFAGKRTGDGQPYVRMTNSAAALMPPFTCPRARTPDPVNIHVGARVKLRRTMQHLSQTQLGTSVGLTFQQIQNTKPVPTASRPPCYTASPER